VSAAIQDRPSDKIQGAGDVQAQVERIAWREQEKDEASFTDLAPIGHRLPRFPWKTSSIIPDPIAKLIRAIYLKWPFFG
jgi:hypothetical protein